MTVGALGMTAARIFTDTLRRHARLDRHLLPASVVEPVQAVVEEGVGEKEQD